MNTGQTLLAVGAMILLSVLILRVNGTFLTTGTTLMDTKFDVLATSIATSEIEEISSKAFDNYTVSNPTTNVNYLSSPLGPESGETYANFDDIDDYNGYVKIDSSMPSAVFKAVCNVSYVNPNDLDHTTESKTWFKKITISVSSISMADTVTISTIYSYWVFR